MLNKMILYLNMLHILMKVYIVGNKNASLIITMEDETLGVEVSHVILEGHMSHQLAL